VPEEARDDCWWLVLRDGTLVPGDEGGGVALLAELRLTRPLARVLRTLRASALVDALDEFLAGQRKRLGRVVPDRPVTRRYP
jgi:hypothetical protein